MSPPATALRVGVDGRAFSSPAAGVRRYVSELTRALASHSDIDIVPIEGGVSAPTNFGRHLTALPLAIMRAGVDLFHAPAYTAPMWGSTPVVLSVHDVSYARHPEWYPYRRDPLRRWFYQRSAARARIILTISEFSKREIIAAYGIPADRIIVTPLGVSDMFRPAPAAARAGQTPFLLHVGDLHERRNLGVAVRALRRLRPGCVRLVLAGVDRGLGATLMNDAARLGLQDAIELRGRVSDEELVALYQQCAALVYPSRYEGFGFPLVEAMACGAPVIAANCSAIPEVAGSAAAALLDPDDEPGFADAIAHVLQDPAFAAASRARGIARAAQFTWHATATATAAAYRRALE